MVLSLPRRRFHPQPLRIIGLGLALTLNLAVLLLMSLPGERPFDWRAPEPEPERIVVDIIEARVTPVEPVPPLPLPPERIEQITPQPTPVVAPVVTPQTPVSIPFEPVAPIEPVVAPPSPNAYAVAAPATKVAIRRGPPPRYPSVALRRGIEGLVLLRVRVGSDGMPRTVEIAESSGHAILDREAREHVLQRWQFVPAEVGGRPVEAWVELPIEFTITR